MFAFPFSVSAQIKQVTLATQNLCPYGCYDENKNFDGCAVQVVKYALNKMNVGLKLVVAPWIRAQLMVNEGKADGFFAASQSEERDQNGVQSALIAEQRWNWYMLRENPKDPRTDDFKEKANVASFRGTNMLKWLRANKYSVIASPPTSEQLLYMLMIKRFDAMLANDMVMTDKIAKQNLQGRFKVVPLLSKPLGVYFSNKFLNF